MNKLLLILSLGLLTGCQSAPKYLEKSSEALSRSVYATGDSLVVGRVELAKAYNDEAQKLVPPPKERIRINAVTIGKTKALTIPASLKGSEIVSVDQEAYKGLVKVEEENADLKNQIKVTEEERQKQDEIHNQLLQDYVSATVTIEKQGKVIAQKNLTILIEGLIIVGILLLIDASFYFKFFALTSKLALL
jgi:starvation-inducible outer membrane lipoprotein